jgi:predicted transposase YbfD/YdcC
VLGQVAVDGESNEITVFWPLPTPLELTRTVITADALHGQRGHAQFLVTVKAPPARSAPAWWLRRVRFSVAARSRNLSGLAGRM